MALCVWKRVVECTLSIFHLQASFKHRKQQLCVQPTRTGILLISRLLGSLAQEAPGDTATSAPEAFWILDGLCPAHLYPSLRATKSSFNPPTSTFFKSFSHVELSQKLKMVYQKVLCHLYFIQRDQIDPQEISNRLWSMFQKIHKWPLSIFQVEELHKFHINYHQFEFG